MRMVVVLPLPLAPRKPQIWPCRDLEVEPVDHAPRAEALAQPVDVDDELGHRPTRAVLLACAVCTRPPFGRTAIGWPGLIRAACVAEGRASTM